MLPLADNFLAGSILSLLLPVCLLIAIAIWYAIAVRRYAGSRTPEHVPPEVVPPDVVPPDVVPAADISPPGDGQRGGSPS